jgi:Domain of unknown function (DUF4160)
MPTVLRVGPYRFYFYSGDGNDRRTSTSSTTQASPSFWLDPVRLARSRGYRRAELSDINRLVNEHAQELMEAGNDYFG